MNKTKICIFAELWESGGIESLLTSVLLKADVSEFEIDVVAAKIGESIFKAPLEAIGVTFRELSGKVRSAKNRELFKELVAEREYDVIHFNLFQGFSLGYIHAAKKCGVPVRIAHAHGGGLRKTATRPLKLLLHRIGRALWLKDATSLLACSDEASDFLFARRADEIVKNGIDTEKFIFSENKRRSVRERLGLSSEPCVGHVGRLSSEKNQTFLLNVHKSLTKLVPDAKLLLVGDGPMREELVKAANELGLGDSVIFYGTSSEVEGLMCAMDAFAFPSIKEGLGIVAIEAQCSGLPVICSDGVPAAASVTPLVQTIPLALGEEAWASALASVLRDGRERRSQGEIIREAGFDSESTSRQIFKYYKTDKTHEVTYA